MESAEMSTAARKRSNSRYLLGSMSRERKAKNAQAMAAPTAAASRYDHNASIAVFLGRIGSAVDRYDPRMGASRRSILAALRNPSILCRRSDQNLKPQVRRT